MLCFLTKNEKLLRGLNVCLSPVLLCFKGFLSGRVPVYQCFGPQIIVTMLQLFLYKLHFFDFLMFFIQHCFICRPQIVQRLGFEPRNVAILALTINSSNLSARARPLRSQPKCVFSFSEIFLGLNYRVFSLVYNVCTSPRMPVYRIPYVVQKKKKKVCNFRVGISVFCHRRV